MTVRAVAELAAEVKAALEAKLPMDANAQHPSRRGLAALRDLAQRAETAERALAEGLAIVEWTTANKPAAGLWRRQEDVDRVVAFLTTARDALAARVVGHEPGEGEA